MTSISSARTRAGSPEKSPTPAEIRAARKAAGLTQAHAAQLIHCSRSSWAEWEGGVSKMHLAFWALFQLKTARMYTGVQITA